MKMGIEEQIKSNKKVRVIHTDSYATDSSSEDETPTHRKERQFPKMKRVVKEIVLEKPDEKLVENQKKRIPSSKYRGVRKRNSRFAAEIQDPLLGKKKWLGTFDTEEEAAAAYNRKRREFQERDTKIVGLPSKSPLIAKSAETNSYPETVKQSNSRKNLDEKFLENNIVPHSPREECQLDQEMNIWFDDEFQQQSKLLGNSSSLPNCMEMKSEFENNSLDNIDIRNCFKLLHADVELIFSVENSENSNIPEFDFEVSEQDFAWIEEVLNDISQ